MTPKVFKDKKELKDAVKLWINDPQKAESDFGHISNWDVSNVKDMSKLFQGCSTFNEDLSKWDVSNVNNMDSMFKKAKIFNCDLSKWNVDKVKDMRSMFEEAALFNGDISTWYVGNVETMRCLFKGATEFNRDISSWNVDYVKNMRQMFQEASNFNVDLSSWDVREVTTMESMFEEAISFNCDLSRWNVKNVVNMHSMFHCASAFNGHILTWNTGNVITMESMFEEASSFNKDISKWDVKNVLNMQSMFEDATSFKGDLSCWDVKKVENMTNIFKGANTEVTLGSSWGDNSTDKSSEPHKFIDKDHPYGGFCISDNPLNILYISRYPLCTACFTKEAIVKTDQGYYPISKISTKFSINNQPIMGISETLYTQNKLVVIEKNAFGKNKPQQKTTVAPFHQFFINGHLIPIYKLVNKETIYFKKYKQELLYNIILTTHSTMNVNNIIVETLDPNSLVAKLFNGSLTTKQRAKLIKSLSDYHLKLQAKPNKVLKDYIV